MSDPSWQRNCNTLVKALQSLDRKTAIIHRSTNKLVSTRDIQKERERIRQTTSTANGTDVQSIQDTMRLVEQCIRQNPALNSEGVKLVNESQSALESYQMACDGFYKKCIAIEGSSRERRQSKTARAFEDDSDDGESSRLLGTGDTHGQQETAKAMFERDLYEDLMAERAVETREIADNVRDIHEIFAHIHEMVDEQGTQLEVVDANLSAAERATQNANRHLRQAQQYQSTSSGNKYLLFFIAVMFVIVLLLLIT